MEFALFLRAWITSTLFHTLRSLIHLVTTVPAWTILYRFFLSLCSRIQNPLSPQECFNSTYSNKDFSFRLAALSFDNSRGYYDNVACGLYFCLCSLLIYVPNPIAYISSPSQLAQRSTLGCPTCHSKHCLTFYFTAFCLTLTQYFAAAHRIFQHCTI